MSAEFTFIYTICLFPQSWAKNCYETAQNKQAGVELGLTQTETETKTSWSCAGVNLKGLVLDKFWYVDIAHRCKISHPYDGHHLITTFFIICGFGPKKFLSDRSLALKYHYRTFFPSWTRLPLVLSRMVMVTMPSWSFEQSRMAFHMAIWG